MEHLSALELLYAAAVVLVTYSVRGGVGFGGLIVPLLALVLPFKLLAPTIVLLGIGSSAAVVWRDYRHINWSAALKVAPSCAIGALIGLWFFVELDARLIARLLGVAVVVYGVYTLVQSYRKRSAARRPNVLVAHAMGLGGGFFGTLFGAMAGIFFAIWLDLLKLDKSAFRVTNAVLLLSLGIVRAVGYIAVGAVTSDVLVACAAGLPLMLLGVWIGNHMHAKLDPRAFGRLVSGIFVLTGIALVVR